MLRRCECKVKAKFGLIYVLVSNIVKKSVLFMFFLAV